MPLYEFTALDDAGKQHKGRQEAASEKALRRWLLSRELAPIAMREETIFSRLLPSRNKTNSNALRMSREELVLFTRQLQTMLQAGLTLDSSLQTLAASAAKKNSRKIADNLRTQLREGESLSVAMGSYSQIFSSLYCALIAAGESGAGLDTVLVALVEMLESDIQLRQKIIAATIYPLLLAIIASLIVTGLMAFIVPTMVELFTQSGQALPLPTRILLTISSFFQRWGGLLLVGIATVFVGFSLASRLRKFQLKTAQFFLVLPLVGYFSTAASAVRYMRTLGTLLQAGVVLHKALPTARDVVTNLFFRAKLLELEGAVSEGQAMSTQLKQTGCFSPVAVALVATAEQSGTLGQQLQQAAAQQQQEITNRMAWILTLLEPAMLVLMGGIVLFVVVAILLPIFNMNNLLS